MRRAAEEEGDAEDGELRRAQRPAGDRRPRSAGRRRVGGRRGRPRTKSAAGISSAQASTPIAAIAVRQSWVEISQPAKGDIVIGAMPMPAETSDREAALRVEPAGDRGDHRREEGAGREPDQQAVAELEGSGRRRAAGDHEASPSSTAPISTTGRGP